MFSAFCVVISLLFFLSADFYQDTMFNKLQIILSVESQKQLLSIMNITLLNALFAFNRAKFYVDQQSILVQRMLASGGSWMNTDGMCITSVQEFREKGACQNYQTGAPVKTPRIVYHRDTGTITEANRRLVQVMSYVMEVYSVPDFLNQMYFILEDQELILSSPPVPESLITKSSKVIKMYQRAKSTGETMIDFDGKDLRTMS